MTNKNILLLLFAGILIGAIGCYLIMQGGKPSPELTSIKTQRDSAFTVIDSLKEKDSLNASYIKDLEGWAEYALDTVKENENHKKNISAIISLPADSSIGLLSKNLSAKGSH